MPAASDRHPRRNPAHGAWIPALLLLAAGAGIANPAPNAATGSGNLAGIWAGTLTHDGESQPVALEFDPDSTGKVVISYSMPAVYLEHVILGRVLPRADGDSVHFGPFHFAYDRARGTLSGVMPAVLVPVYGVPIVLRHVERFEPPARPALTAPLAAPLWTFDAQSPLWAGPTFANGTVFAGAENGTLLALDARTGARKWSYRAGGAIRVRPVASRGNLYFQADDGYLYKVSAGSGQLQWRLKIVERPIERLPFDNPKSRFDRFGSDVTIAGGRLFVGTHEGKLLAIDPDNGKQLWEFAAGDAVLAAPAVRSDRLVFGSYDHFVYALDPATGNLLWKRDTRGAVVSTPALDDERAVVGNRCYDLLGLNVRTGEVMWKRYIWGSWVESSAQIKDGVAYVGSSDAAALYAFDVKRGERRWAADVFGWAWGQPAVGDRRVYIGTSSQVGYLSHHAGGAFAVERGTGKLAWRFVAAPPDSGPFGFPGSPALGLGRAFFAGLDGRVYAFAE